MDINETIEEEIEDINFGEEVGKALILSAAASAGTIVGFVLAAIAIEKTKNFIAARKAKKLAKTEEA